VIVAICMAMRTATMAVAVTMLLLTLLSLLSYSRCCCRLLKLLLIEPRLYTHKALLLQGLVATLIGASYCCNVVADTSSSSTASTQLHLLQHSCHILLCLLLLLWLLAGALAEAWPVCF
jgi:hypothetical protein